MSGLNGTVLLIAVGLGAFWLVLAALLVGGRLLYDVSLGSLRTAPEAWPVRGGEAVPKRAAPALFGTEVGTLAQPSRPAPVAPRVPAAPRRKPVAPVLPARPTRIPTPSVASIVTTKPQPHRSPEPEPVPASETPTHVAA